MVDDETMDYFEDVDENFEQEVLGEGKTSIVLSIFFLINLFWTVINWIFTMQCKQMISNTVKFWQRNNYYEHFSFLVNPIYVLVFNASL